ncbi:NAD(P)-dependent glycerol-3-phosphate dehydrogenase [Frankia sp. CNm7]|uniref:Glycerol-3-phosphate dehydrogenase [NAD(P)+] n=1 Tax=Frankia nepalensis TaxID=1836974 RepID=A0A937RIK3_9ACTN|nr:NAD(P)H-dependent glycerol-3-phosphate dehydrogenase [Frankia nepalensis]MBL7497001.1 NAD(P)-dependent glycerol-3-phosphate dehydrogenase [Frankia nepalensis]MBL7510531.1 NAD(P)-dependent glycerol-3-phosphate dehydrogenase [Frankia nepalensis]MBL7520972.1 NAD(P)-dependent glycerol-3-phosphate dehydrogenase [Frankia nepalensis]MBL7629494.1 NAD(P)-dependent glycerol-3-phosphate dehydrogenase [Frankia nepalensis]
MTTNGAEHDGPPRVAAVLTAGSWGTVFGKVLADAGRRVTLLTRDGALAERINKEHHNPRYLPAVRLPDLVRATCEPAEALAGAGLVVLAVPSQALRAALAAWAPLVEPTAVYVSLMKGVENGSCQRMSEVISEVAGVGPERVAVVSGPNLAAEIAAGEPAATVVASASPATAAAVQAACWTSYLRPYTNADVVGCELGGAAKNVIALAAGMLEGLGFGANTLASLMTRGLAEVARLGTALGADPMTFAGLAGLGDLVATCASPLSRNRAFGEKLGQGMTMEAVLDEQRQVAEGVRSCRPLLALADRLGVHMPISRQVERVLYEGLSPLEAVKDLMSREPGAEYREPMVPEARAAG